MKRLMMVFLISLILLPSVHASAADLGDMRFSLIRGDVQVRTEDTGDWVPASVNMPLREGDRIWVPEQGTAEIQTKDGSYLRLADRSALEILSLDSNAYQAYLTEGRLYAYFRGNRDSLLQIDTLTSSVRAYERSKFKVDVAERGPVHFSVVQGEVMVENREGRISVASGEMLSLGEGAYSEKSILGSPDDWERWNWERDREIAERRPPSRYLPEELQPYSNDFHDNGRWVNTPDYGYVWTPAISVSVGWAPYRHGRWTWIGGDYVWVSYEPWGWVPYHYGRWYFAASIGWCWVPPVRGAVYWGPGYVGWVYTNRHVAWVPLAPREVYYGRGHYGPHSVNITNVNVTNVHVDKVVYKNVKINNAVTTVDHNTFVRGRPAEAHVKENPFLTEKVHVGRPPIKPEKTSAMPVVREVPQTKRPPEPIRKVDVRELKEQRPMVKSKEASVFAPETRPREMPVKRGEAKPVQKSSDRVKEMRQPSRRAAEPTLSAPVEKQVGQPVPSGTKVETPKESEKPAPSGPAVKPQKETSPTARGTEPSTPSPSPSVRTQERGQGKPSSRGSHPSVPSEPSVKPQKETSPAVRGAEQSAPSSAPPVRSQERGQGRSWSRGGSPAVPSESGAKTQKEMRAPERGVDKQMERRPPERSVEPARSPERVQPKNKEPVAPEKTIQQPPEPKATEKRTERPMRGKRNSEKGA
ncbi:MAG: FecR domain-containing protein [Desulfobacterota bacterium]|nr:FecR domain-containing protein [Thermodesulfobacteriota bacterium]